jgi:hypothetical protein
MNAERGKTEVNAMQSFAATALEIAALGLGMALLLVWINHRKPTQSPLAARSASRGPRETTRT